MEFLVQIEVNLPPEMPAEELEALMKREFVRGMELKETGMILRIWRIPGRRANVAIWQVDSVDALHEAISSLPVFPWIDARITALATHRLEARELQLPSD